MMLKLKIEFLPYFKEKLGIEILSYIEQVEALKTKIDFNSVTINMVESNVVRCPDLSTAEKMIELIKKVKDEGDSIGGIVRGIIKNVPISRCC